MLPFYKERVKEIEKEILAIANNAPYVDFRRTRQQLDERTKALARHRLKCTNNIGSTRANSVRSIRHTALAALARELLGNGLNLGRMKPHDTPFGQRIHHSQMSLPIPRIRKETLANQWL